MESTEEGRPGSLAPCVSAQEWHCESLCNNVCCRPPKRQVGLNLDILIRKGLRLMGP